MLVSQQEMVDLTGAKSNIKQIEVLSAHSIRFIRDAKGRPQTTWEAVNAVLISDNSGLINWEKINETG